MQTLLSDIEVKNPHGEYTMRQVLEKYKIPTTNYDPVVLNENARTVFSAVCAQMEDEFVSTCEKEFTLRDLLNQYPFILKKRKTSNN